jgi:signal transduction histidine kinase
MIYFLTTLILVLVGIVIYLGTTVRETRRKLGALRGRARELEIELERQASSRGEVVNELIERYENEILKMGADIHDDLIQKLTVYRLHVDKLEHAETILEVQVIADRMKTDFKTVVDSIRRITRRLLPEMEIGSFTGMMRELCRREEKPGVAFIRFKSEGQEVPINESHQPHLLRIVQELINNATKHTLAWHIEVRLDWKPNEFQIEVEDDGKRFDDLAEKMRKPGTFATLRMRTGRIGAHIRFAQGYNGTKAIVSYMYGKQSDDGIVARIRSDSQIR